MEQKNNLPEIQNPVSTQAEIFLEQHYEFRRNVLRGIVEFRKMATGNSEWRVLTDESLKSIFLHSQREVLGVDLKADIKNYVESEEPPLYDPIRGWLTSLPKWDKSDRVVGFWQCIPGVTAEQIYLLSIWMRSMVAHWLGMDTEHGNECVPVLIGSQGSGKSTFCKRILPLDLRCYFLDHFNLGNKFDKEMALSSSLLINLDELDQFNARQMTLVKQALSKSEVNARRIFGRSITLRHRYASFIATTNCRHPLTDPTGSRRFICIEIPERQMIDNASVFDYEQLYAQIVYELQHEHSRYWFNNEEVMRIQQLNVGYEQEQDLETIISFYYRKPKENETSVEVTSVNIRDTLRTDYPFLAPSRVNSYKIGHAMKALGFEKRRTERGMIYSVALQKAD